MVNPAVQCRYISDQKQVKSDPQSVTKNTKKCSGKAWSNQARLTTFASRLNETGHNKKLIKRIVKLFSTVVVTIKKLFPTFALAFGTNEF